MAWRREVKPRREVVKRYWRRDGRGVFYQLSTLHCRRRAAYAQAANLSNVVNAAKARKRRSFALRRCNQDFRSVACVDFDLLNLTPNVPCLFAPRAAWEAAAFSSQGHTFMLQRQPSQCHVGLVVWDLLSTDLPRSAAGGEGARAARGK